MIEGIEKVKHNEGERITIFNKNLPRPPWESHKEYVEKSIENYKRILGDPTSYKYGDLATDDKGNKLFRSFISGNPYGGESVREMEKFFNLNDYFSIDIETMGDTGTKDAYSITEVASHRYNKKGELMDDSFTKLVRPSDKTFNQMNLMMNQFELDPTVLNRWDDGKKRMFADYMRYSTIKEEGMSVFERNGNQYSHHSIVEDMLTEDGRINYGKIIDRPKEFLAHARSGFETLGQIEYTQEHLAQDLQSHFMKNKGEMFLTYNGRNFDMPVITDFVLSKTGAYVKPDNHLDLYQALNTINPSKKRLSSMLDTSVTDLRLQTLVAGFADEGSKHSASADVEVLSKLANTIEEELEKSLDDIKLSKDPKGSMAKKLLDYNSENLRIGDTFKVKRAYSAWKDDDESFIVKRNPVTGELEVDPYGNNKFATEAKAYYQFGGFFDLSDEESPDKTAMRLVNPLTDEESYIIKKGPNAYSDLEGTLHSNFEAISLSKEQIELDREIVQKDRARRAYDRLFDITGQGQGVYLKDGELVRNSSVGYEGAKRFFSLAAEENILEREIEKAKSEEILHLTTPSDERRKKTYKEMIRKEWEKFADDLYEKQDLLEAKLFKEGLDEKDIYEKVRQYGKIENKKFKEFLDSQKEDMHKNIDGKILQEDQMKAQKEINERIKESEDKIRGKIFGEKKEIEKEIERELGRKPTEKEVNERLEARIKEEASLEKKKIEKEKDIVLKNIQMESGGLVKKDVKEIEKYYDQLADDEKKKLHGKYLKKEKDIEYYSRFGQRLRDEVAVYGEAIKKIEKTFADDLKEAVLKKDPKAVQKVARERDEALYRFHQKVGAVEELHGGTQSDITGFSTPRRIYEANNAAGEGMKLDVSDYSTARQSIFREARRGIRTKERDLNRELEGLVDVVNTLQANKSIKSKDAKRLIKEIRSSSSSYTSAGEVAKVFFGDIDSMPGLYEETVVQSENIDENKVLREGFITQEKSQELADEAISEIRKEKPEIYLDDKNKPKLNMTKELIDKIGPEYHHNQEGKLVGRGNIEAIESLLETLSFAGRDNPHQVAIDIVDNGSLRADFYLFDEKDHMNVYKSLDRGVEPPQALRISLPLIGEDGTQRVGGIISNAHRVARTIGNNVLLRSTSHDLAESLRGRLGNSIEMFFEGDRDEAQKLINSRIHEIFQKQAGINRGASNFGLNDMMLYSGNESDFMKQSLIDVESASIRYMHENEFDGFQLKDSDFHDSAFYESESGQKYLKKDVTFMDLKSSIQNEVKMRQLDWFNEMFKEDGLEAFSSGVKSDKTGHYVSTVDGRDTMIFGSYSDAKRDNMIQWTNAFRFKEEDMAALEKVNNISFVQNIVTPTEVAIDGGERSNYRMQANMAVMDDAMITKRIQEMMLSEEGRGILERSNILREDGSIDWSLAPRTHEQQIAISEDVYKHLNIERKKVLTTENQFVLSKEAEGNGFVQPGAVIGYEIQEDGTQKSIINERKSIVRLEGDLEDPKQINLAWREKAHKLMVGGDKGTMVAHSQELLDAITGLKDVSLIFNPDVEKHKDFNLFYAGEMQKIADRVQSASGEDKKRMIDFIESKNMGVEWDEQANRFLDITNTEKGLQPGEDYKRLSQSLDEIFAHEDFSDLERSFTHNHSDGSSMKIHSYRTQTLMSGVYEYAQYFNEDGERYAGYVTDSTGKPLPRYIKDPNTFAGDLSGGAGFGHRELRTAYNLGMGEFHSFLMDNMKARDRELGEFKNLSRSDYLRNIYSFIDSFEEGPQEGDRIFRFSDFKKLPKTGSSMESYQGTIFDDDFIKKQGGGEQGFWMELPSYQEVNSSIDIKPEIEVGGEKKEIDKVFIPYTQNNGANGNRYNDKLQSIIQNIYRRAEAADQAETSQDRVREVQRVGHSIDELRERAAFEISSSKGISGELVRAELGSAGSNMTSKTIDSWRSEAIKKDLNLTGEFAMISKDAAVGMGIYDQLKSGEEIHGVITRFPTFNDRSTVFGRILLNEDLQGDSVHITEKMAVMLNADNDGDALHLATPLHEGVQQEFKQMAEVNPQRFQEQMIKYDKSLDNISSYLAGETGESVDTIKSVIDSGDFTVLEKNTVGELSAKIGKSVIGSASNYNYSLQQAAGMFYAPNTQEHSIIQSFGSAVEQRIISSKHGASEFAGEFIRALKSNNWDEARQIDFAHYDGMFTEDYGMDKVRFFMENKIKGIDDGLYNQMFDFGKGSGVMGSSPEEILDTLRNSTYSPTNQFITAVRDITGIGEVPEQAKPEGLIKSDTQIEFAEKLNERVSNEIDSKTFSYEGKTASEAERMARERLATGDPNYRGFDIMDESTTRPALELDLTGRSPRGAALVGLGGALAGGFGVALAGSSTPTKEDFENYTSNKTAEDREKERISRDFVGSDYLGVSREGEMQSAQATSFSINAKTTGSSLTGPNTFSRSLESQLGGSTNVNINTFDNVSNLTNNWYRDIIAENI